MKSKGIIFCLLALCIMTLMSCEKEKTDYTEKVVGDYNIKITPYLNAKFGNSAVPLIAETIETTCHITKIDEDGYVVMKIDGVNGMINDMTFTAYCDGLGMKLNNNEYEGLIYTSEYGMIQCDVELKNPTVSIYNSRMLSWESSVTGECEINISGLDDIDCDVTGEFQFEATSK